MHDILEGQLRAQLEHEATLIMAGNLADLNEVAKLKMTAFQNFAASSPGRQSLANIHELLKKNEALLEASILGVKDARARLKALQIVQDQLRVYTPNGKLAAAPIGVSGVNKRS